MSENLNNFLHCSDFKQITNRLNYFLESDRVSSFTSWPYNNSKRCNVQKLAEAGFYHDESQETSNCATCFYCGKCLEGWEQDDDPWYEHKMHSECKFANLQTPQADLTVQEFLQIKRELMKKIVNECFDSLETSLKKVYDEKKKQYKKLGKNYK